MKTAAEVMNKRPIVYFALICSLCVAMSLYSYLLSYILIFAAIIFSLIYSDKKTVSIFLSVISLFIISRGCILNIRAEELSGRASGGTYILKALSYPEENVERIKFLAAAEYSDDTLGIKDGERIFVYIYKTDLPVKIYPGSIYEITGNMKAVRGKTTPGGYDYKNYLLSENVFFTVSAEDEDVKHISDGKLPFGYEKILSVRYAFEKTLDKYMSELTSGLLKGIMFSSKETDMAVTDNFRILGISHVLAVSGLHVGIIYSFFMMLISRIKTKNKLLKRITRFVPVIFIIYYIALSGFSVSCIRAAFLIMLSSSVSENKFLRGRYDTLTALGMIALISMVFCPFVILGAGFILSYLSVVSISLFNPPVSMLLRKYKERLHLSEYILSLISVSISAQLGILPVSVIIFGESTLMSVIFNLIFVHVLSLCLNLGIMTLAIPVSSPLILPVCDILLSGVAYASGIAAKLSVMNVTSGFFGFATTVIYYLMVLLLTGYVRLPDKRSIFLASALIILTVGAECCKYFPPKDPYVSFLDVGFGDCAVIVTEKNECILIDSGGGFYGGDTANDVILPYLKKTGIRKINAIISTHSDADHSEGILSLIGEIPIDVIFANNDGGKLYYEICALADMYDVQVKSLYRGESLEYYDCEINILSPDIDKKYSSQNDSSIISEVILGGVRYLFMADGDKNAEMTVTENAGSFSLEYDILKSAHHGSDFKTDEFRLRLFTDVVIISVGNNGYGLPNEKFISSLEYIDVDIFRTDQSGLIKIISHGGGKYDIMSYMGKWRKIYESE